MDGAASAVMAAARLAATFTPCPAAVMLVTEAMGTDESDFPKQSDGVNHNDRKDVTGSGR